MVRQSLVLLSKLCPFEANLKYLAYHFFSYRHVAHKGGTDPKEKNHITASFYDKNKIDISNNVNGRVSFFSKNLGESHVISCLFPTTEKSPHLC